MALEIITEIETTKGTTSQAYLRIGDYRINRYNIACFMLELYLNQSDSVGVTTPVQASEACCSNVDIGQYLYLTNTDTTEIESMNVYQYGYKKLKARMVELYGAENVIDC